MGFNNVREFELPYIKRNYITNKHLDNNFANWITEKVDNVINNYSDNIKLVFQFHPSGGQYKKNKNNGTSYEWRDMKFGVVFDLFYKNKKDEAEKIQYTNDIEILNYGFNNNRFFWSTFKKTPYEYDYEKIWYLYNTPKNYYLNVY